MIGQQSISFHTRQGQDCILRLVYADDPLDPDFEPLSPFRARFILSEFFDDNAGRRGEIFDLLDHLVFPSIHHNGRDERQALARIIRELQSAGSMLVMYQRKPRYMPAAGASRRPERPPARALETESQVYSGRLVGPVGPLPRWPFLLKRDGAPIDQRSLHGSTSNNYRDGAWISGADGGFRFENLAVAGYSVEVLLPSARLVVNSSPPPSAANESGRRAPTPNFNPFAFTEDPEELLSEGDTE